MKQILFHLLCMHASLCTITKAMDVDLNPTSPSNVSSGKISSLFDLCIKSISADRRAKLYAISRNINDTINPADCEPHTALKQAEADIKTQLPYQEKIRKLLSSVTIPEIEDALQKSGANQSPIAQLYEQNEVAQTVAKRIVQNMHQIWGNLGHNEPLNHSYKKVLTLLGQHELETIDLLINLFVQQKSWSTPYASINLLNTFNLQTRAAMPCRRGSQRLMAATGTSGNQEELHLWHEHSCELETLRRPHPGGQRAIQSVIDPSGERAAFAYNSRLVHVATFADATRQPSLVLQLRNPISSMVFSKDGRHLAVGLRNGQIALWSLTNNQPLQTYTYKTPDSLVITSIPNALAFSPDNKYLLAGATNGTLNLFNTQNNRLEVCIDTLTSISESLSSQFGQGVVESIVFCQNGTHCAVAHSGGTVVLYGMPAMNKKTYFCLEGVSAISFTPDDEALCTATARVIKIWNIRTKELIKELYGMGGEIEHIAFEPDGAYLLIQQSPGPLCILGHDLSLQAIFWLNVYNDACKKGDHTKKIELLEHPFFTSLPPDLKQRIEQQGKKVT